ncbi:hypothetical protein [Alicyclobacillus fodiniaquatilis]|uniref:Outer membrane lipoprotein-sorting protein n=1 Tax=Alicyclobacillus fodiniaquatilis TaxID=1661150 RepID=A0ABW4JG62_9BACL
MSVRNWWKGTCFALVCIGALSGCAPGQQPSSLSTAATATVIDEHANWKPLEQAILASSTATLYKIKSSVSLKNGSMHTSYTAYGTVNLPDKMLLSVHENNFNISFFQQGQVAYADENGTWTHTDAVTNLDAYGGYVPLVQTAAKQQLRLIQLKKVFVVNEYCNVYQVTVPQSLVQPPAFLEKLEDLQPVDTSSNQSIQYTFYVGQKTGKLREVQTQSINSVDEVGPVSTATDTTFFDIDDEKNTEIQVPLALAKTLEHDAQ